MRALVILLLALAAGTVSAKAPVSYKASLQGALLSTAAGFVRAEPASEKNT